MWLLMDQSGIPRFDGRRRCVSPMVCSAYLVLLSRKVLCATMPRTVCLAFLARAIVKNWYRTVWAILLSLLGLCRCHLLM